MNYVDHCKFGKRRMCHMMTDGDIEELHAMALSIGLRRAWFQDHSLHPHYDLTASKRAAAIRAGAVTVSSRELIIKCSGYIKGLAT